MVLMCAFAGLMAKAQYKVYVTPVVPLHTAVSGHFAGLHNGMLRTWGGCNFPDLPLADGGQKRFYPVAYGACVPWVVFRWTSNGPMHGRQKLRC